ncbi:MAG: CRISPR-associated endonuclease Cas2 [Gammaproteobacteria bacterium]
MKQWSLFAYDIRNEKRLQRVRRCLEREAMYCQHSVYLACLSAPEKQRLLQRLHERMKSEDDLRVYPVRHPREVWQWGNSQAVQSNEPGFFKRIIQF